LDLRKIFSNHLLNTCFISGLWLFVLLLHWHIYGIVTHLEAEKYISEAENIIDHKGFSAPRFWFYSVTIYTIAASLKLKAGLYGAVIIQSVYNLLAILFFHRSLQKIFQSNLYPFFIVLLLIIFSL